MKERNIAWPSAYDADDTIENRDSVDKAVRDPHFMYYLIGYMGITEDLVMASKFYNMQEEERNANNP